MKTTLSEIRGHLAEINKLLARDGRILRVHTELKEESYADSDQIQSIELEPVLWGVSHDV